MQNISRGGEYFTEGFTQFKDINDNRSTTSSLPTTVTKLARDLLITDANILVSDSSILGEPNPLLVIPGIVAINGERIVYYGKNGNWLTNIRRGQGGTGTPHIHYKYSDVEDVGPSRNAPGVNNYRPGVEYKVYPSVNPINEGVLVKFIIETKYLNPGTVIYWKNIGTTSIVDFVGPGFVNQGQFTLAGSFLQGRYELPLTLANDAATEGTETIIIQLRLNSQADAVVAQSDEIRVIDTSKTPTYKIEPQDTTVAEGDRIEYLIETTGVPSGTTLYWQNTGTTSSTNFAVQSMVGQVEVVGTYNSSSAFLFLDTVRLTSTDPTRTVVIQLYTDSARTNLVKTANVVYISDVPNPAYYVTPSATEINENGIISFMITTTGVPVGTVVYYEIGGTVNNADFVQPLPSAPTYANNITITGSVLAGSAEVIFNAVEDLSTEGYENLLFTLYSSEPLDTTTRVVGPLLVRVRDTSIEPRITITANPSTINEGQSTTISITTEGILPGATLYLTNTGTTASGDFASFPSPFQVTVSGTYFAGTASLTLSAAEDLSPVFSATPEGAETVIIDAYLATPGPGVSSLGSVTITVLDTSTETTTTTTTEAPSISPPPGQVLEQFFNGDFEFTDPRYTDADGVDHLPGWSIYRPGIGTTPNHLRLNGFSNILGWPTPTDPTPRYAGPYGPTDGTYGDDRAPVSVTYSWQILDGSVPGEGGTTVNKKLLELSSAGTSVSLGVVRGPYMVSDNPIDFQAGDRVVFNWKAEGGGDDFDVFAYLLDVSNGKTILLLDLSAVQARDMTPSPMEGSVDTSWQRVEKVCQPGEEGVYRFVFICGSFDWSGGTYLGARLKLDNIDKIAIPRPTTTPGPVIATSSLTGPSCFNETGQNTYAVTFSSPVTGFPGYSTANDIEQASYGVRVKTITATTGNSYDIVVEQGGIPYAIVDQGLSNMNGTTGLTRYHTATSTRGYPGDDSVVNIVIPFSISFPTSATTTISGTSLVVGTNSFIALGSYSGSGLPPSPGLPPIPAIFIGAMDSGAYGIWAGSTDGNQTFIIRFEGTKLYTEDVLNRIWEVVFYASDPTKFTIKIDGTYWENTTEGQSFIKNNNLVIYPKTGNLPVEKGKYITLRSGPYSVTVPAGVATSSTGHPNQASNTVVIPPC